jgi:hypothetical protein
MTQPQANFPSLTTDAACAALRTGGFAPVPADIRIERRDEKWAVFLPDDRIAWFPADDHGRDQLTVERKVLRLLAERCTFLTPRILFESPAGYDVRAAVPGRCDPWGLYEQTGKDSALARRIGGAIGAILAEQHTRVAQADGEGWLPTRLSWPEPGDWIRERLPDVVDDKPLIADIERLLPLYEEVEVEPADRVLVHADLGLHNIAVDPATHEVRGVFDYGGAAWADRHHDFRYLVFDRPGEDMLEAALAVYEPAVGRKLNRQRIRLYNAVCAACFLAFRRGIPADEKWCGRTLAEDVAWVRGALGSAL